jgi:hypothetical protein
VTVTEARPEAGSLVERRGNVLVITINRPDARDALAPAQDDPEIGAGVITASVGLLTAGVHRSARRAKCSLNFTVVSAIRRSAAICAVVHPR